MTQPSHLDPNINYLKEYQDLYGVTNRLVKELVFRQNAAPNSTHSSHYFNHLAYILRPESTGDDGGYTFQKIALLQDKIGEFWGGGASPVYLRRGSLAGAVMFNSDFNSSTDLSSGHILDTPFFIVEKEKIQNLINLYNSAMGTTFTYTGPQSVAEVLAINPAVS